jgi:hypothetical protein
LIICPMAHAAVLALTSVHVSLQIEGVKWLWSLQCKRKGG